MGGQITIWKNGCNVLILHELIFYEFSQNPCPQKHIQRTTPFLTPKIQRVPRVYSKGKANTVDMESPHI